MITDDGDDNDGEFDSMTFLGGTKSNEWVLDHYKYTNKYRTGAQST